MPFVEEALRWLPARVLDHPGSGRLHGDRPPVRHCSETAPQVLIADDNADMRDYLGRILGQSYRIEAVGDGGPRWSGFAAALRISCSPT